MGVQRLVRLSIALTAESIMLSSRGALNPGGAMNACVSYEKIFSTSHNPKLHITLVMWSST